MIHWSQGLFGFVSHLQPLVDALSPYIPSFGAPEEATPPQTPPLWDGNLDIKALASAYRGGLSPVTVVDALYKTIEAYKDVDSAVWIHLADRETVLKAAKE